MKWFIEVADKYMSGTVHHVALSVLGISLGGVAFAVYAFEAPSSPALVLGALIIPLAAIIVAARKRPE
jgi:FtsH-binding integral membrane protein